MREDLKISIVVVIPAYQPDEGILSLVKLLKEHRTGIHVIVVNDGSCADKDYIFSTLDKMGVKILKNAVNLGKGNALKFAFNHALVNYPSLVGIVTADADGQHLAKDIFAVLSSLEHHPRSLVLGCRDFGGGVPFRSKFGNQITKYVFRFFTGKALSDTQTGLRGIPADLLPLLLRIRIEGYDFEMEMLVKCCEKGVDLVELPIETVYEENNKSSHFNPLIDSFRIYFVFIRFATVSLVTSALDTGVFAVLILMGNGVLGSIVFSRVVASAFQFGMNRSVVFKSTTSPFAKGFKYTSLVILLAAISYVLIQSMGTYLSINPILAKIISEGVLFLASFSIQKTFIFRRDILDDD
jgi:glycosyltransferase involved in cell wall biosynthesis